MDEKDSTQKRMSQMERAQSNQALIQSKIKNDTIKGRVIALTLSTFFFGYALNEVSLFPGAVWYHSFGPDMVQDRYLATCHGLIPFGAAIGVVIAYYTQDLVSRRTYLIIINIIGLFVSAILQAGGIAVLFIFRILQGAVCGIWLKFIPTYINQLSPDELGSRFGVYPQIAVVLGVLVAYLVGMIMTDAFQFQFLPADVHIANDNINSSQSQTFWRVMLGLSMVPGFIQLILIFVGYIPQSPIYLISKNQKEQARQVLNIFYQDQYVDQKLKQKEEQIDQKKDNDPQQSIDWTSGGYFLGFVLAVFPATTGIASYVVLTGNMVAVTLQSSHFYHYVPIIITLSQLVGTFISMPLVKYLEPKSLLLIGGFGCSLWNLLNGLFFHIYQASQSFQQYGLAVTLVSIVAFFFTFGLTIGSANGIYASNMMPSGYQLIGEVINWVLLGLSIVLLAVQVSRTSTPQDIIWVFSAITFIISVVNWLVMIDIKGLTKQQIQQKLA